MPLDDVFTYAPVHQQNSAGSTFALITEKFTGVVEGTLNRRSVIKPMIAMEQVVGTDTIRADAVGESVIQVLSQSAGQAAIPDGSPADFSKINLTVDTVVLARTTFATIDEYQQNFDKLAKVAEEHGKKMAKFIDQAFFIQAAKSAALANSAYGATMDGHFGGYTKTLSAAGDATDPAKLYAAILDVLEKMSAKDVDVLADGVVIAVKPAQYFALAQNEFLIRGDYITSYGNTVNVNMLKAWGVPVMMSNNYMGGLNITAHQLSNARNSNAYNGDFTKHVATAFAPKSLLAGETIPLQSKMFYSDTRKLWFVDAWTAFGVTPNRGEFAANIVLP
jgi:hypothetical protein